MVSASLEEAVLPETPFDAVTLVHALEHFADPVGVTARALPLLKPGGVLFVETPNADSDESRAFGEGWLGWNQQEHVCVFTPAALTLLLEKVGFRVIEVSAPLYAPEPASYVVQAWAERPMPPYATRAQLAQAVRELTGTTQTGTAGPPTDLSTAFVTRGEAAIALAQALGLTADGPPPASPFSDVPAEHLAFRHIHLLWDAGIVSGRFDSTFAPDDHLLRGDLQRLIDRCREWLSKRGR